MSSLVIRFRRPLLAIAPVAVLLLATTLAGCCCVPQQPTAFYHHPVIEMRERFDDIRDGVCLEKAHDRVINDDFQLRANLAADVAKCATCKTARFTKASLRNTRHDFVTAVDELGDEVGTATHRAAHVSDATGYVVGSSVRKTAKKSLRHLLPGYRCTDPGCCPGY